ncbi:MAG TPA: hypothetical protein VK152_11165 [Paludibacter sp.]|nr:hypothetical protein [Paludibacter sp.]
MEKLQNRLRILLVSVLLIAGWTGWFLLQKFLPDFNFNWYFLIPSFFLLFGFANIRVLAKTNKANPRKPVNVFLMFRLTKFLLSFALLGAYYLLNGKTNFREFALVFAVFYFIYLGLETLFFYLAEKTLKSEL